MTKYVVMGNRKTNNEVYHTDKSCRKLSQSQVRETSRQEIKYHNLRLCKTCSDEPEPRPPGTEWKEFVHNLRHGNKDL